MTLSLLRQRTWSLPPGCWRKVGWMALNSSAVLMGPMRVQFPTGLAALELGSFSKWTVQPSYSVEEPQSSVLPLGRRRGLQRTGPSMPSGRRRRSTEGAAAVVADHHFAPPGGAESGPTLKKRRVGASPGALVENGVPAWDGVCLQTESRWPILWGRSICCRRGSWPRCRRLRLFPWCRRTR